MVELKIQEVASILIAILALATTVWNSISDRRHKKLSVKPKLMAWRTFRGESPFYGFQLINNGTGPAEITEFSLYLDDIIVNNHHSSWSEILEKIGLDPRNWFITRPNIGLTFREGEDIWILRTSKLDKSANETIRAFNRVKVKIEYKSMYNDIQPIFEKYFADLSQIISIEEKNRIILSNEIAPNKKIQRTV